MPGLLKRKPTDEPDVKAKRGRPANGATAKADSKEEFINEIPKLADLPRGKVLVIGTGDVGQLGLGVDVTEKKRAQFVKEIKDEDFIQVEAGGMHSVAVSAEGKVYTWGCNDDGALGRPTSADAEDEYDPTLVTLLEGSTILQVSAGDSHTAALTDDGRVYAWGAYRDSSGLMGLMAAELCKKNEVTQLYPIAGMHQTSDPAVKIASGQDHTAILTASGTIYTAGTGEQGQLGRVKECFGQRGGRRGLEFILQPQAIRFPKRMHKKFTNIFCGSYCTLAVDDACGVYAWGLNNYGQLCNGNTDGLFAPSHVKQLSELCKASGSLVAAAGEHHVVVSDGQGNCYSAGRAEYGRLGLGSDAKESSSAVKIPGMENVKSVSCSDGGCSFAIDTSGRLFSWGQCTSLQLGVGDEDDDVDVPTLVTSKNVDPEQHTVLQVSSGGQHTMLLVADT